MNKEALELVRQSGNRHFAPGTVMLTSRILAGLGRARGAWRLRGASLGMWAQIGETPPPEEMDGMERDFASLSAQPESEDRARCQAEGRTLGFDVAVDEALDALRGA